ncbi:TPA: 23S rRNA (pseudouridine(1915)-N(3))-methyltransferase RlmH [Streptococcus pneumoniae]|nr:23S rRNA (pseudouridine(1915)-N(3))-methyltransferase RlmH [Streptococcus pneumoniae]HEV1211335.1 23S rRNA (pseudouridine(1915)-N(3))-methyltransferase RlmH [Streptococcus pneumoniae]HEV1244332.1 23S rRNA (pseudouridine(1915)-N(3))-methyltransferase RlmH [Streptococcus pneumoniae]
MKIKVVTVGKLKEKYLKDGIAEYSKRISRFAKFEMIELSDEKTPDKASESENQKILEIEGQRILSKIADRDFVIVLAIEGKTFFSEEFSKQLEETSIKGFSTLTFIIGGSLGLSSSVKNRANLSVSFGRLTLPHQLMRLVLVEQIYRAFTIQQGFPYHKVSGKSF